MNQGYRKISKINYNGKQFLLLKNHENKYAFLEINNKGHLNYPNVKDFLELSQMFSNPKGFLNYRSDNNNKKNNLKFKMKILFKGMVLPIGIALSLIYGANKYSPETKELFSNIVTEDINEETVIDLDKVDITEEELDYIFEGNVPNNTATRPQTLENSDYTKIESKKQILCYEPEALAHFLGTPKVDKSKIEEAINSNSSISSEYKEVIKDYANTMIDYYPGLNLTCFYENLKTVKIWKLSESEIKNIAGENSKAFYDANQNIIVVNQNLDLKEDTNDIVIFRHELTHMFNIYKGTKNDYEVSYRFQYKDEYYFTNEALTVIISTAPFENRYSESTKENMGYALTSNTMRILLSALPNASIQDLYVCHVSDLANYLDNNIDSRINGQKFLDILELMSIEYYNPKMSADKDTYKDLYAYIGDAYKQNIITNETTNEEKEEIYNYIENQMYKGVNSTKLIMLDSIKSKLNIQEKSL